MQLHTIVNDSAIAHRVRNSVDANTPCHKGDARYERSDSVEETRFDDNLDELLQMTFLVGNYYTSPTEDSDATIHSPKAPHNKAFEIYQLAFTVIQQGVSSHTGGNNVENNRESPESGSRGHKLTGVDQNL